MLLTPKTRLGNYEIVDPLGAGGMGEVYRARDTRLGREIAIKVLPAQADSSPDRLARLEHEARTVAGLNHPNIVTLFSVEDSGGVRFLTMELIEGRTLSMDIAPAGLPVPRVLDIAIPIADALAAAHEGGVIHRDLKPANIMVTREGRIKILDFGLAKMKRSEGSATDVTLAVASAEPLSDDRRVVGTLPYMAPEQLRANGTDPRSDLFSLGVILYELTTGHRPFTGGSAAEVTSSILRDAPEPMGSFRSDLPADLERIVAQCLAKNPRERVQSARDVCSALRDLQRSLERGEPLERASGKLASIAVLPFVNRSANAEDEYFSDGLADELLSVLAGIKGLRVTARTSSFYFKGKESTIAAIGEALGVATLLEGSVRKAGNRVRISVQLIRVSDSSHLWSETYDRTLEDIFAVQDDIARSVVRELRTRLLGEDAGTAASGRALAEVKLAVQGRATDPESHRLYLLARHLLDRVTPDDTAKAIRYLEQAVARDPRYGLAWSELGRANAMEGDFGWTAVADAYGRARTAVEHALSLQPDLPEGHARLGWIRMTYDWDWSGAEESLSRAVELSPQNSDALRLSGVLAESLGRLDEAIRLIRRALEQDPLSAPTYNGLGYALNLAGRFTEAEAAYRRALELTPQRVVTRSLLSLTLFEMGRGEEGLTEAAKDRDEGFRLWALAILHHRMGRPSESDAVLQALTQHGAQESAFQIAEVHAARGEVDLAFEWMERAYTQRDGGLADLKVRPYFRSLHADPRWRPFLKRMRLEP